MRIKVYEIARHYGAKLYDFERTASSIEHGGTRPFFYMVDQYFNNDF